MVQLTQSLEAFLIKKGRLDLIPLLLFGHVELLTDELCQEYSQWCQTEEGRSYLKGGANYKE